MSRDRFSTEELTVYRGNYLVALLSAETGDVASALRGAEPCVVDAVVSGKILVIEEEKKLAALIENAASLEELLELLSAEGYSISR